jgi:hypothetical protein
MAAKVRCLLSPGDMRGRLGLHTVVYVLSASTVMAVAFNPTGTARFLRRHTATIAATVRAVSEGATAATGAPVVAAAGIKRTPPANQTRPRDLRPGEYRVPIGTAVTARLKSAIDSGTAQANDQIDAVLSDPVRQDDVELIPGGSILHGTVVKAEPATRDTPRGRVEIVFTVVQHAQTRSRAAIRTRPLMFEAEVPPETGREKRTPKKQPIDLVLPAGAPLLLTLADTLVVYIPPAR